MSTLVLSDLHLGARSGADLLRGRPEVLAALRERLRDVQRLVLLGDTLELRHGPRREALAGARELLSMLGEAMAGREIVLLAGNHDHPLIGGFLEARALQHEHRPLGVEQRFEAADASRALATLAQLVAPARLSCAYPGLWLRDDVYATHGHYLDCHITVPTLERIGIGAIARFRRRPLPELASVDEYEAATAPVYAWIDAMAAHAPTGSTLNGDSTARAWRALRPDGERRPLRLRALAGVFPLGVAALNAAGLGPVRPALSGPDLRRAGLAAMGEVVSRLGIGAEHVIFGHTHRAGPLEADDRGEWRTPSGARLLNCGSWTYDWWAVDTTVRGGPYWPGTCVVVPGSGDPWVEGLLEGVELRSG